MDKFIGGRGINVKLLFDELEPCVQPFDPENLIIFGPGALTGTPAPNASRMAVSTLLPYGHIASSNMGAFIGAEMRYAGINQLIIQGKSDKPVYLFIHDNGVEFIDAGTMWGRGTDETQETIKKELKDPDAQVMCIGPAAENLVSFSCIMTGMHSAAGHGGFGAVMGSKNLKAVAVRGKGGVKIARLTEFLNVCSDLSHRITQNPAIKAVCASGDRYQIFNAASGGSVVFGNFEAPDTGILTAEEWKTKAEQFWNQHAAGKIGCVGCPMYHFDVFSVPDVGLRAAKCTALGLSFSTRLWNSDYELMFKASTLCNSYGLDSTSTTNIIAFLMELYNEGIISERDTDGIPIKRGDPNAILTTIHKLARQEGFGRLFRDGLVAAAKSIGKGAESYAMHVKGLEMSATEPRISKSQAMTYAMCRDIQDAPPLVEGMAEFDKDTAEKLAFDLVGSSSAAYRDGYEKKGLLTWDSENRATVLDSLGICKWFFLSQGILLDIPAKLYSLATGRDISENDLLISAQRVRTLERATNVTRGLTRKDDTLPERLFESAVPQGKFEGTKLDKKMFNSMVDEYYAASGWDANGIPREEIFRNLGLDAEWQRFQQQMKELI